MWIFTHNQGDKIWKKQNQRQKNLFILYSYNNLAHISMLYNKRNVLQIHNSIRTLYQKWNWSWTWIKISIKPKLRLNQKSLQKRLNTICWLYHHCICLEIGYLAGKLIGDIYSEWIPNLNQNRTNMTNDTSVKNVRCVTSITNMTSVTKMTSMTYVTKHDK